MTTNLPTRQQVDDAAPLDFPDRQPAERQANITIEVAPDGLHIRCEYTGTLASIPAAVARLRAAGVLDLVKPVAPALTPGSNWPNGQTKPRAQRVAPTYNGAGEACCPTHGTPLREGRWGLFCPTKDKATDQYCPLKFES